MHPHQKLIDQGVVEAMPDGRVRMTAFAWDFATQATEYSERAGCWHFVGFKDDRYHAAVKAFGKPDFVHRFWDRRAVDEVAPTDVVIFADGDEFQPVREFAFDDSANF